MLKKTLLKQNGFTLIELLVAMAISAILLAAIGMAIINSMHLDTNVNNETNATNQLKNAFNYISKDAEMAGNVLPGTNPSYWLTLGWIEGNQSETINYSILSNGALQRQELLSNVIQSTTYVANYVNPNIAQSYCTWNGTNDVLTVNMTVSIGTTNAARQFIITPREVQGALLLVVPSQFTISSSSSPSAYGQSVTFTATVTGVSGDPTPTGSVQFLIDGTNFGNPVAMTGGSATSGATTTLSVGNHSVEAVYSGDAQYSQSTSSVLTQMVNEGSSATTVSSSSNPSAYGSSVTFTATVSGIGVTPTGTVQFVIDGTSSGSPVSLSAATAALEPTSSLTAGTHSITAVYSGDSNYNTSTSSVLTQTVNKGSTTVTLASSLNPSGLTQSVTFTATMAPNTATGTVTFKNGSNTIGTGILSGGTATFATSTLSAGSDSITAVYSGDSNYNTSTSSVLTQVVSGPPKKLVFTSSTQSIPVYASSGAITIQVQDTNGNPAYVTSNITISLSSSSSGTKSFSATSTPWTSTSSVTMTGSNTVSFYYEDTTVGSPVITVSSSGLTGATQTETVTAATLASITVSPSNPTVSINGTQTFTAQGYDTYNNPVSVSVTWSVVSAQAGSINSSTGVFTAGTVTNTYNNAIVATSGTITGHTSVTVKAVPTLIPIGQNESTNSDSSLVVTVPSGGVAAGNTIIVMFAMNPATSGTVSVIDSRGNAYTSNADVSESGGSNGNIRTVILSAPVRTALASGNTITITYPSVRAKAVSIYSVSDLASASVVDQTHTGTGINNSPSSGTTVPTTQASELLIGAIGGAYNTTTTFTAGGSFTALQSELANGGSSSSSVTIQPEYELISATGAYSATGTLSTSRDWSADIVTFKTQ